MSITRVLSSLIFAAAIITTQAFSVAAQQRFVANMNSLQTIPPSSSQATGRCQVIIATEENGFTLQCTYSGIASESVFRIHQDASVGETSSPLFSFNLSPGSVSISTTITRPTSIGDALRSNRWYVQIDSPTYPDGEIRGQIKIANGTYNDYDGDGRTDVQVYRNSNNTFYALRSTDGAFLEQPLGQPGDSVSLTVDWDRDGRSDFSTARYNAEVLWRILPSTTNVLQETRWGSSSLGDFFAAADYDGDGAFDIAVFRAGVWYIIESSTGNVRYEFFGQSGDVPAANDFDGDGKADLTIARSENGQRVWWIRNSSNGAVSVIQWGLSSDAFFTGRSDFDGDGKADLMVIRNQSGQRVFYIRRSSDGALQVTPWGLSSDVVKLGDYDGDGKTDPAITRAINGQRVFFILQSTTGQPRYETFGLQGDF
jgi:hypothetical protein